MNAGGSRSWTASRQRQATQPRRLHCMEQSLLRIVLTRSWLNWCDQHRPRAVASLLGEFIESPQADLVDPRPCLGQPVAKIERATGANEILDHELGARWHWRHSL